MRIQFRNCVGRLRQIGNRMIWVNNTRNVIFGGKRSLCEELIESILFGGFIQRIDILIKYIARFTIIQTRGILGQDGIVSKNTSRTETDFHIKGFQIKVKCYS